MDTLIEENRTLKREVEISSSELEELRERVDTLKYLEEEASEENEILRYKVLSLEGGSAPTEDFKLIEELKLAKREMHSEVEVLRTQVKSFRMLFGQQISSYEEDEGKEDDPMIHIGQLKLLYDLYKQEISEEDLNRVLTTLYLKDSSTYRYYRESLFASIAKKAIEQAEFMYKNRGSGGAGDNKQQSRLFVENKRLKKENERMSLENQELST